MGKAWATLQDCTEKANGAAILEWWCQPGMTPYCDIFIPQNHRFILDDSTHMHNYSEELFWPTTLGRRA